MTYRVEQFINGQITSDPHATAHSLYNPATGDPIAQIFYATSDEIQNAVHAAKTAFTNWSLEPPLKRARVLCRFKDLIEKHIDELAALITQEHGKLLSEAKGSIIRGLEIIEYACGIADFLKGNFSENVGTEIDCYSMRQPLGVCVGITPFNFPAMVPLWMAGMAIACGNTFILKPSEKDPSSAMYLAKLFKQAGLPDGVFNVLQGDKVVVDSLLSHPEVAAFSFVGSTPVAQSIYQQAATHNKRVQAFGGAKNHCVVMPDANIDQVANAIVGAAYGSAGERCMAISVVVAVGDETADKLVEKIAPCVAALNIGDPTHPNTELGPLVTKAHLERVKSYVDLGIEEGATLVVDRREQGKNLTGFFLGGCLFDNVKPTMRIYQEEIFGPVLCVVRVKNFTDALTLVNQNPYGNGTAIFTHNGGIARTFVSNVNVGMVGVNIAIPVPIAYYSFGGWKNSMFGDVGMYGSEGVRFYTKLKTVTSRWPMEAAMGAEFVIPGTR